MISNDDKTRVLKEAEAALAALFSCRDRSGTWVEKVLRAHVAHQAAEVDLDADVVGHRIAVNLFGPDIAATLLLTEDAPNADEEHAPR
jgi:hypothetical protein